MKVEILLKMAKEAKEAKEERQVASLSAAEIPPDARHLRRESKGQGARRLSGDRLSIA